MAMAMVTTPIISPPASSSSTLHRKTRSIQQYQQQQKQQPFSPPSSAGRTSTSQHGNTIATPAATPPPPLKQQQQTSTGGKESPRFRLSKLLSPLQTHHLHSRSEQDQQQLQSPLSPQQQHQHHQQAPHHHRPAHNHSHRLFSPKHANPASRFRRGGGGGFFGFLQSHYHVFHRSQDQQQHQQLAGRTSVNGGSTSNVDKRDNAAVEREREQQRRRRVITVVSPPPEGRGMPFMSNMYSGNNCASGSSNNFNISTSAGTVHSGYNMTISDFRAHATIASTRSENLPTKVTDVVFERRGSCKNRDFTDATPPMTPPPIPDTIGCGGGGGFRASLRSLGILGPVTSSPSPPPTAATTPTQPRSPFSLPHSPTLSTTTPSPSSPKQRRMSGQGFFCKDRDKSRRDDSPSSSPSTSKLASRGWVGKMAFLYSKRKPSLPLQSHYLSLPVGGAAAATSPTAGTGGMYMLHSEDLSVTEFAKLAGITIVQDEDDPTTYDSQFIGNEIHEHCRRGSSTTELTPPPSGGLLGPEYVTLGSAGNTLNSEGNLTVGSNGSFGGGSLRRTQIWDPQFWSDPVRDGAAMTSTNAMVSNNNMVLPSASTSSLPITSGSFVTRPPVPEPVGSSAPNSPRLKPQSSLPSSDLSYGASPPSPSSRLGTASTPLTLSPPVPTHEQRRRNSCSPAVLMPAAGSRAAATATAGSEIDRARHLTSSGVLSLRRADQQQQQQLPRPGSKDAIQLSQDLGRRPSFTSLTAIALELEGGSGESGEASDVQDVLQAGGAAVGGDPASTISTPRLFLEPSTPIAPTKTPQLAVPPAPPSMSHTLAMHALHTPRSRGSVPGGSGGGHSSRSGVSRTRSPSPSPLSRQIDLNSLESPQEERCDPLDMPWKGERIDSLAQLSPSRLVTPPPAASKSSRQNLAHGRSGKNATKPSTTTKGLESANTHLTGTAIPTAIGPAAYHRQRGKSMPLSLSDQELTNTPHRRPPQACTSPPPPSSASSTPASSSRSNSPNPNSSGRTFTPGTKVGRFTLVQERCTKHVDLLQAQQAQRRASLGEMGVLSNGASGEKKGVYLSPASSSSTFSLTEDAVLDSTEWVENPMLKPEDNVRVFQRKRSRRILDPLPQPRPQPQYSLTPPPPVSY